jgi:hypothetical protein
MTYEAGALAAGRDRDTLAQSQQNVLETIHLSEYTHALLGLAIAIADQDEGSQFYWLTSLASVGRAGGEWVKGRDPHGKHELNVTKP